MTHLFRDATAAADRLDVSPRRRPRSYEQAAGDPVDLARWRAEKAAADLVRHGAAAGLELDALAGLLGTAWAREVDRGHW